MISDLSLLSKHNTQFKHLFMCLIQPSTFLVCIVNDMLRCFVEFSNGVVQMPDIEGNGGEAFTCCWHLSFFLFVRSFFLPFPLFEFVRVPCLGERTRMTGMQKRGEKTASLGRVTRSHSTLNVKGSQNLYWRVAIKFNFENRLILQGELPALA
jgi:hypothetical protein